MNKKYDIKIGMKFERLIILELFYKLGGKQRRAYARCLCDCGNILETRTDSLIVGRTKSCGCFNSERIKQVKHGFCKHPLYKIWTSIIDRCDNKNSKNFKNYGGRGIKVSEEFHNSEIFIKWCLENGWKKDLQIDRINNNYDYTKDNIRFATRIENNNNKRTNRLYTYNGVTKTLKEWSRDVICVVSYEGLRYRLNVGWSFYEAISTPSQRK